MGDHPGGKSMSIRDFLTLQHAQSRSVSRPEPTPIVVVLEPEAMHEPEFKIAPELQIKQSCSEDPQAFFYCDVESRSAATLGKGKNGVGARAYAEHPTTEVLCVAYARGNDAPAIWVPPEPIPEAVLAAAADPNCKWVEHHAAFDRAMLETKLVTHHGWPTVPVERHICTMTLALAHSYPGGLDAVAMALGLQQQKDVAAQRGIEKMFKPRKPRADEDPCGLYWHDTPELRAVLYKYAKQDMMVMRELHQRLAALPEMEREVAVIDAEINDRGVLIDARLAMAASRLARRATAEMDTRIKKLTKGEVVTASQVAKLKAWLVTRGVKLQRKAHKSKDGLQWRDSLDGDDIEKLLAGELPHAGVRAALEIRLQAAQSAASKIDRMLTTRCADGRVRNVYRMHGARTGRWSGRGLPAAELEKAGAPQGRRGDRRLHHDGIG
jgi:DNA polymerase bacteriophage-type